MGTTRYKKAITIVAVALGIIVIFAIGMEIGYIKAGFSYKFGDNYYRSFGKDGVHPLGLIPGDVGSAHGLSGTIISTDGTNLVIEDRDNTEKDVSINDDTVIREFRNIIKPADLKNGDFIVVIGNPDESAHVEAKFIRVLPPPPVQTSTSASSTPITK